ncbi:MAG: hypothetical protein JXJ18_13490 [Rhodobacteraceae bacterium]|nr:hypothetical protein [Paracoccaceae bacterium]
MFDLDELSRWDEVLSNLTARDHHTDPDQDTAAPAAPAKAQSPVRELEDA